MSSQANEAIQRLVQVYVNSRNRLLREFSRLLAQGQDTGRQEQLLAVIAKELRRLNNEAMKWTASEVKAAYLRGMQVVHFIGNGQPSVKTLSAFGGVHREAVKLLQHNAQNFLLLANNIIARQAADTVRKIGVEITKKKFEETLTMRETKKLLMDRLTSEGFYRVPWRNGKGSMRVDSYSELVARTTTAEATNTGTLNQMTELGHNLVEMTAHHTTCKVCAPRQGRVYRLVDASEFPSGDPRQRFPHISEGLPRWPEYKTVHPNCMHRIVPYIWEQKTAEENTQSVEGAKQSFTKDPRSEAERERYERGQKVNADRLRDRKEWEKYRYVLGQKNTPTFSGFRAMKRHNSTNYQELKKLFRSK